MAPSKKAKIAVAVTAMLCCEENKKKKRVWIKEWLKDKCKFSHVNLVQTLKIQEPGDYKNFLRMDDKSFDELLKLVRPKIEKKQTHIRATISAEDRLIVTLRFLATGNSYEDLKFSSAISPQLLGKIIPETCWAIFDTLQPDYLRTPSSKEEWQSVAKLFKETWQFENCLGALDGKHVLIKQPADSGSYYYNYKGTFSVVLFAVVNANYEFLYVHTGTNGRMSDGGILKLTDFYTSLISGSLNIPDPVCLEGSNSIVPFVFLGDEAFALMPNLMKPYSQRNITKDKKIFNYRLSRTRRVVENAFGIMANRFRVLLTPIAIDVKNVDGIILACTALHNFLRRKSPSYIQLNVDVCNAQTGNISEGMSQSINENMLQLQVTRQVNISNAEEVREKFKQYYNSLGAIEFQDKYIH